MQPVAVVYLDFPNAGSRTGRSRRAEVVGVRMVESIDWRGSVACFEARYPDGSIRYQPIDDRAGYRIIGYDRERGGYEPE